MAADATLTTRAVLDSKPFSNGIDQLNRKTDTFASKLGGMKSLIAGAFTIGAITSFSRKMLSMADNLQTAANTVGITMESMLGLQSAMAESGIGADTMLRIFSKLTSAQAEVVRGSATFVEYLKALNISQEEFVSLGVDDLMERIARAYAESGDSAGAFNAVAKIFGEDAGPKLIEVLGRLNKEGLEKFKKESAGAVDGMTELAKASDLLEGAWNRATIAAANFVSRLTMVKDAVYGAHKAWVAYSKDLAKDPSGLRPAWDVLKEGAAAEMSKLTPTEVARQAQPARAAQQAQSNIADLKARQESDVKALAKKQEAVDKRIADQRKKQAEELATYQEKRGELLAGKGVPVPGMARVDSLQQIGGIVGGVAGAGDQRARIAERQAKAAEMVRELTEESLKKLEDIETRIRELGDG